jgi:hypothetical protein
MAPNDAFFEIPLLEKWNPHTLPELVAVVGKRDMSNVALPLRRCGWMALTGVPCKVIKSTMNLAVVIVNTETEENTMLLTPSRQPVVP